MIIKFMKRSEAVSAVQCWY